MEKQGMDRRKRNYRPGLLIRGLLVIIFLFSFGILFSQDKLDLRIESTPSNPLVNGLWTVFILVNHPNPSEVTVKPPDFPSYLFLERVRTGAETVQQGSAPSERWTRIEFSFTPQMAQALVLEPFEVSVPGRQALTEKINVSFREQTQAVRRYEPSFRWLGPIPSISAGAKGEITLELSDWDPQKAAPRFIFRGRAPINAILEESLPLATGAGSYRYIISIIPIDGNLVTIDYFSFQFDIYNLSVPQIAINVLPAVPAMETAAVLPEVSQPEISPNEESSETDADLIQQIPFPETREKVFPFLQASYNRIIAATRALWEENRRAEALAELRRNERDSLSGPFLSSLRREMEQAIGLGYTEDEDWRPLKFSLLSWAIAAFLILVTAVFFFVFRSGAVFQIKNVTSRRRSGFMTVIVLVLSIGLIFIFLEESRSYLLLSSLGLRQMPAGNSAVLKKTTAYRIPDYGAAVNTGFDEGQPVIIVGYRGEWCYAETSDGRSGWVKREAVITY